MAKYSPANWKYTTMNNKYLRIMKIGFVVMNISFLKTSRPAVTKMNYYAISPRICMRVKNAISSSILKGFSSWIILRRKHFVLIIIE